MDGTSILWHIQLKFDTLLRLLRSPWSETAKAQNSFDLFFRNSNGACDHQLNSPECMYDGGDCCVPLIFDRFCSYPLCQCRADRTQHSFCKYLPINLIPIILYSAGLLTPKTSSVLKFWIYLPNFSLKNISQTVTDLLVYCSGVHVLLVSLFGIPIVRSISHFFGHPKKNLVDQKKIFLSTRKKFGWKKKFGIPKKNEKLTGQLVYQRDWPKVHGRR